MTRRLLIVCTANVCRSPIAERLIRRALDGRRDVDGCDWTVTSAGTGHFDAPLDPAAIAAAADVGIDVSAHRPRPLDGGILAHDGADLVITMARSHLPAVVGIDPGTWPRTFTLKQLARQAQVLGPPDPGERLGDWLARMAAGRQARDMMSPDPADDIADPYGMPKRHHEAMIEELVREVDRLVAAGPWTMAAPPT